MGKELVSTNFFTFHFTIMYRYQFRKLSGKIHQQTSHNIPKNREKSINHFTTSTNIPTLKLFVTFRLENVYSWWYAIVSNFWEPSKKNIAICTSTLRYTKWLEDYIHRVWYTYGKYEIKNDLFSKIGVINIHLSIQSIE